MILAAVVGLGATWLTLTRGVAFGALTHRRVDRLAEERIGRHRPLRARDRSPAPAQLPVGTGDGVAFYARSDDAGNAFDGRCTFLISGVDAGGALLDASRSTMPEGRLVANTIDRHGFTSAEIVREADGRFAISVAPRARPGNWLPTGGIEQFVLVWRLYDTPIGVATRTTKEGPMPAIVRKGCS